MQRPFSQLIHRRLEPDAQPARQTVIALHGEAGNVDNLVPLARSLGPALRVVAVEAARAVWVGRAIVGHNWFGGRIDQPEPASFGDSLAQIERFVHDELGRRAPGDDSRPFLVGVDQGAVLALAAAGVIPDLLAGVMAVRGALPAIRDWHPPYAEVAGLPVLLITDPADSALTPKLVRQSADRLRSWGAAVTQQEIAEARQLGPPVANALRGWLSSRAQPS